MKEELTACEDKENFVNSIKKKQLGPRRVFGNELKDLKSSQKDLQELYIDDTLLYLQSIQSNNTPTHGRLSIQPEINEKMRTVLIDWLFQVHYRFELCAETLFLTINILDRYLERSICSMSNLQLVGISSLWIASKFEELYYIDPRDLVRITTYKVEEMYDMEFKVLKALDYKLCICSSYSLAMIYLYRAKASFKQHCFVEFYLELCLFHYFMLKYPPDVTARAAVYLMSKIENCKLDFCIDSDTKLCAKDLCNLIKASQNTNLKSLQAKFLKKSYCKVASIGIN